jgi:hypothetical protein
MALGLTQPLKEMSTRDLPEAKGRFICKVNTLPSVSRLAKKCGSDVSQPYAPPLPVTGTIWPNGQPSSLRVLLPLTPLTECYMIYAPHNVSFNTLKIVGTNSIFLQKILPKYS